MQYVNGHPSITKGLWTRDRGHSKSVVDYVAISEKHLHTVKQSEIDDKGKYGGGSDHNWMFFCCGEQYHQEENGAQ